ncbi:MAG: glycosyltransferase family 2 protein, partial [Chloroflexi bacterium]|nr:glycosyltransferase family 2 protein [Chloroflexota bacterium]
MPTEKIPPVEILARYNIAAVVPAYKVEKQIEDTLARIPSYIRHIIVVDDASPDRTGEVVSAMQARDSRILLVRHGKNQGVGGAMASGFAKALALNAQIVIKIDGDGQMSDYDPRSLLAPLVAGEADYVKGNRFRDFSALKAMPRIRQIGNMALGFLVKAATGYWDCFDPTNGYLAIRGEVLSMLPLERIDRSYFFETSMLGELYLLGAVIRDVPYPAVYGDENSNLSVGKTLWEFPPKLAYLLLRRMVVKNFLLDFSMESIYLLTGIPMLLFGLIFGVIKWIKYARLGIPAPTGTIMIPVLSVMLGVQILLAAIGIDLQAVPREPV